jgi:hypothetical protein
MKRTMILAALFAAFSLSVNAQEGEKEFQYRRSSLATIMLDTHDGTLEAKPEIKKVVVDTYNAKPTPDKYNDHNIDIRSIDVANLPAATDDEIKAIAKAGGLIQLASGRFFLSDLPKKEVTIKHLADHIDYIKNLVGAEYIGLGTDFDGGGGVVGLEDCSKMKDLTKELLLRGYTPYELSLFWGGNFLRVWQKIIDVSKELKKVK